MTEPDDDVLGSDSSILSNRSERRRRRSTGTRTLAPTKPAPSPPHLESANIHSPGPFDQELEVQRIKESVRLCLDRLDSMQAKTPSPMLHSPLVEVGNTYSLPSPPLLRKPSVP